MLGDSVAQDLKRLAQEVREATDRTSGFALDIETAVAEASEHMRGVRERALAKLEALPEAVATAAPVTSRSYDDAQRLLERVREMVQDAARKGERLSAAGERASRAAERLTRRLEDEGSEAEALVLRLTPLHTRSLPPVQAPGLRLIAEERSNRPATAEESAAPNDESPSKSLLRQDEDRS